MANGTGPFTMESFEPGVKSVSKRQRELLAGGRESGFTRNYGDHGPDCAGKCAGLG